MDIRLIPAAACLAAVLTLNACGEPDRPTIGLYPALQRDDINQIQRHIYWGTDLNQPDTEGRTPLHIASKTGQFVIVELLLDHGGNIDATDSAGLTPLHVALMNGRTQVSQLLIKRGAAFDPNRLLIAAVKNKVTDRDVIEFLVKHGADINYREADGITPLTLAVMEDQRVLTKWLIAQGADINARDEAGHTPLWHAKEQNNEHIIRLLTLNGGTL